MLKCNIQTNINMKKISKNIYLIPVIVLMLGFLFWPGADMFAQEQGANVTTSETGQGIEDLSDEIKDLNEEIDGKQRKLEDLEQRIRLYEDNIDKKQDEALTLQSQVDVIEIDISKKEASIEAAEYEIEVIELQSKTVELKIEETEQKIDQEQESLNIFLKELYVYSQKTYLEIAINYTSFSEYFREVKYLEGVQGDVQEVLTEITDLKISLDDKKIELDDNKQKAEEVQEKLALEKEGLKGEQVYIDDMLAEVEQDEDKFQALVNSVKQEKQSSDAAIVSLERQLRAKIVERKSKRETTTNGNTNQTLEQDVEETLDGKFNPSWPIASRRITAYFHDPEYPFRRWFEHSAIDLGTGQGTPLKAVAPGYVAIAKDAGLGYSYIMIVHSEGFSSVYGHVSSIHVSPEEYVTRGQVIGLSGGTPGLPGTGSFSTGPHLHFEIRLNGIPVDPLNYLP